MKKLLSVFISFVILTLSISCCFSAVAEGVDDFQYKKASNELQDFAKEVYALTSRYDSDIDDSHNSSETNEVINFMASASIEDNIDYECFETNRLIVYSDEKFETYGAIEHLSGYEDMHLLQYKNLEDTINAYSYLSKEKNIDSVEPDVIVELNEFEEETIEETNYINYPHDTSITPSWGYERIQTYDAFQYILQHKALEDLPEIVVGIIDDGVNTGNKYFDERLISAYTFIGTNPYRSNNGHGSQVAGVILENTLPNVKIISYQVFERNKKASASLISLAEAQAELDKVDIVNSSYGYEHVNGETANYNYTNIQDNGYLQIAGAGNNSSNILFSPASTPNTISVASIKSDDNLASHSNRGQWVDVAAPGANISSPITSSEGKTSMWSGTSCATPFVVSVCAMIMTQYPSFSNSLVADVLFKSCDKSDINVYHGIVNMFNAVTYYDADARQTAMPQFSLEAQPENNQFYAETQYVELTCSDDNAKIYYTLDGTIPSKTNGTLYTEPIEISTTTSIYAVAYTDKYFKSEVAKRTFLVRIPLSDYPNENGWHIRDNGMIWGYSGADMDLIVPETVLGIEVKGIESEAFSEQAYIKSIIMPECLTVIEDKAFYKCNSLTSLVAPGITDIGASAFYGCGNLDEVYLPNLQTIEKNAFRATGTIDGFPFENLKKVPTMSFYGSDVYNVNLENATSIQGSAFAYCTSLTEVSIPKVDTETDMGTSVFINCPMLEIVKFKENTICIPEHTFNGCNFSSLDCFDTIETIADNAFSNNDALTDITMKSVEYIGSSAFENCQNLTTVVLPRIVYVDYEAFKDCSSLTSLTLSDCVEEIGSDAFNGCENLKYLLVNGELRLYGNVFAGSSVERLEMSGIRVADSLPIVENSIIAMPSTFYECKEDTKGRNYNIYGTSGTYAEEWAKENGHTFINIYQDTAILKDVPMEYTGNGEILSPDVIGFNRTYQWYSNTEPNNTTGTPIEGATNKEFNPAEYPDAPYYYCVVTSTDKGCDPIEIRTGITENKVMHIHTEEEIPAVAPTCTETGLTVGVKCSECGEIITAQQEIPALGHDYNSVVVSPTCTEQGYTTYTCECGDNYVDDYVDTTGHADNDGDGYCDECSETVEVENPPDDCDCGCHKSGIRKVIYIIILFFQRLLGLNKTCDCGVAHY